VKEVYLNYSTLNQKAIGLIHLDKAKAYLREAQFVSGSRLPKLEVCIRFLEYGGECSIVSHLVRASLAIEGKAGTNFLL